MFDSLWTTDFSSQLEGACPLPFCELDHIPKVSSVCLFITLEAVFQVRSEILLRCLSIRRGLFALAANSNVETIDYYQGSEALISLLLSEFFAVYQVHSGMTGSHSIDGFKVR